MPSPPTQPFPPIAEVLRRLGIRLSPRKSQHFLRDQEVCRDIAELAELGPGDLAIEVGTGLGNLTVELAARAGRVASVEMDPAFKDWHRNLERQYPALRVIGRDFLQVDLDALILEHAPMPGSRVAGVGNLPYQITAEIFFKFVDHPRTFDRLVFMVQREVAERVAAGPGNRAAGALTYKIALRYNAQIAFTLPPEAFLPPPAVHSSILVLDPLPDPPVKHPAHRQRLGEFVDGLFRFRRKTLQNGLRLAAFVKDSQAAAAALDTAGIPHNERVERLNLQQVIALEQSTRELRQP